MGAHAKDSPGFIRRLPLEIDALNFALTLEHMENAFYVQGLAKFTHDDFIHAGFPDWSYGRLKQIAAHEVAHVKLLETTLGEKATKPCAYNLSVTPDNSRVSTLVADALSSPYDDPKSFITLSHALEAVGKYIPVANFSVISLSPFKGPRHTSARRSHSKTR